MFVPGATASEGIDELAREAMRRRESGEWAAAADLWSKLAELSPNDNTCWLRLVESHARDGNLDGALECLLRIDDAQPLPSEPVFAASAALILQDCLAQARVLLGLVAPEDRESGERLFLLGRLERRAGNVGKAEEFYRASMACGDSDGRAEQELERLRVRAPARLQEPAPALPEAAMPAAPQAAVAVAVAPEPQPAEDGIELLMRLGRTSYQKRQFDLAAEAFRTALTQAPELREAMLGLARSLSAEGKDDALGWWDRILTQDPGHEEALQNFARLACKQGRAAEAKERLEQFMASRPPSPELRLIRGRVLAEVGDLTRAEAVFRELATEQPNSARVWTELGRLCQRGQRWADAGEAWQQVLAVEPEHLEALRALSDCFVRLGQVSDALELWRQRAAARPENAESHIRAARLHAALGAREQAVVSYVRGLEADPRNLAMMVETVRYFANFARHQPAALDLCARWQQLAPDSVEPLVERGRILERLGRLEEAEKTLNRARKAAPQDANVLAAYARLLHRRQRWQELVEVVEPWIEAAPRAIEPHLLRAEALSQLGRDDQAEAAYRALLAEHPENVDALLGVARICRRLRRLEEAFDLWRRASAIDPQRVEAWANLVVHLANADREAESLVEFERARAALGDSPAALATYAEMMDVGRFLDRAPTAYEAAATAAPNTAEPRRRFGNYLQREGYLVPALRELGRAREIEPGSVPAAKDLIQLLDTLHFLGIDERELAGAADGEILVPERYFARLRTMAPKVPLYEPVPGRVVMVNQGLGPGGAERQLAATIRGLAGQTESTTLFCSSLDPRTQRDFFLNDVRYAGCEVVVPAPADFGWTATADPETEALELIRRLPPDMGPVRFWMTELRRRRPAVVHAWQDMTCLATAMAAVLAGVPTIVLGTRSVRPDNPRRRFRRWMRVAYQNLVDLPSVRMINNSRAGADDYAGWIGIAPERIDVVYNGLDLAALAGRPDNGSAAAFRQRLGIAADAPVVGGVFRFSEEKRPLLWVETAALVAAVRPDARFVLCGEGPMLSEVRRVVERLGLADRFHLAGNQPDIGNWYRIMDVVLLTSRHEGLPNVLIEAQSLGIPVVVPAVGGAPEALLSGTTGFAVPDANAATLAERVGDCLDPAWRGPAAEAARSFARERFTIDAMVGRILQVYELWQ